MFARRKKLLADRTLLGRWGERRSERYLKSKGFRTLARNFSCKGGEIDLIMVDPEGTVVFVEVKTRADESFGPTENVITSTKTTRMKRAARYFLAAHDTRDRPCRLDAVTIVLGHSGRPEIRHYPNAFGM